MSIISDNLTACVLVLNDEYFLPYALEASRGWFGRYVIYDCGSTDKTKSIIKWFQESNKNAEYFTRDFDCIPSRSIQGAFRNSMIAEARTEWFFLLDADEVYNYEDYYRLSKEWSSIEYAGKYDNRLYGVVKRLEVSPCLTKRYSIFRTHHRIYNRLAIFEGPHPGERVLVEQKPNNEIHVPNALCIHFHNAERSSKSSDALKREERKSQHTYHPGTLVPFNLLDEAPLLRKPIENFPVCPALKKLQDEWPGP